MKSIRFWLMYFHVLLALGATAGWAQEENLAVVPVGERPVAVAINPVTNQAFVLNKGSRDVFVIDLQARSTVAKYLVGGNPEAIALNPRTNQVVVVSSKNQVTIIDHSQGKIVATISGGKALSRVAVDVEKNIALVTDFDESALLVIDLATRQIGKTISVRRGQMGVAVLEGMRRAVVAAQYDMELLLIDFEKGSIEKQLLVGHYVSEVAVNQATGQAVVGNPTSNGIVAVYDPVTNSVVSMLPIGDGPLSAAVYPKRNVALIGEYNSGTASLVDLRLNRVIKRFPVAKGPMGVAIHPDTGIALVISNMADCATFIDIEKTFAPPPPPPKPPPPIAKEPGSIFLLLPDNDGKVGQITVSNAAGTQLLNEAGTATEVAGATSAPVAPFQMSQEQIARIFGSVIAVRPPLPAHYILYFDLNSTQLTAESRGLIPEIIRAIREKNSADISVIGHCDTTGNAEYNNKLSLMRAQAVSKLIMAEGISPAVLDIASHGKNNPLIPTGDKVPEPKNRRVEIIVR